MQSKENQKKLKNLKQIIEKLQKDLQKKSDDNNIEVSKTRKQLKDMKESSSSILL